MALIKSDTEIEKLREGGKILATALSKAASAIRPGISTLELNKIAEDEIRRLGGEPAFLGYQPEFSNTPFPAALCVSVNEEIVHGIPRVDHLLQEGDIVSLDLGVKYKDLFTDAAMTLPVGEISEEAELLIRATREAFLAAVKVIKPQATIGDIASAVEGVAKKYQLGVIRDLVGHGVGHSIHEPPSVPNFGEPGTLDTIQEGLVIAIEPMFALGDWHVNFLDDGWTVRTKDRSLSSHFEHTVAVTKEGCKILTELAD